MRASDLPSKSVARAIDGAAENLASSHRLLQNASALQLIPESLSDTVKDRSLRELSDEATGLANRQPIAFFAGAVVAGFALARFLKSSNPSAPYPYILASITPGKPRGVREEAAHSGC